MIVMVSFTCNVMIIEKIWILGAGLGKSEYVVRDARKLHRKTIVGVGRSDGHESNSSFHSISQIFLDSRSIGGADDGLKERRQGNPLPTILIEGFAGRKE